MVTIAKTKKVLQEEPKVKPTVYYQESDLAYSKWALSLSGVYFVRPRLVPEFTAFMYAAGYTAVESRITFSVDNR